MTDYDDIQAMNWSSLKRLHVSAKLFDYRTRVPEPDKESYRKGRAIHCAVLEPDEFVRRYYVPLARPDGIDGRTKEGKAALAAWRAEAAEQADGRIEELTANEFALALACAAAVRDDRDAAKLLRDGRPEVTVCWTDRSTGIACKARVDYLRPGQLVELKSTSDCGGRAFGNDCAKYLYHGQVAFYLDGCVAAGLLPRDAIAWIVAVESAAPHDVACYSVSGLDLDAGRALYRGLLERYAECTAAEWWPGKVPDPQPLELPRWAPGMREAEEMGAPMPSAAWDDLKAAQREAGR